MSMERYEKYKPSGIEWIGEIPENWEVMPIKALFSTEKGLNITKADLVDEGIPVVSYGQIHSKLNDYVHTKDALLRFIPESLVPEDSNASVKIGDFVFADTSEDVEGCGNSVYIDKEGVYAGYHTVIAKSKSSKNNKYLAFLFSSSSWRSQIRSQVYGVKVYSITQQILNSTKVILPPPAEQEAIAAYLDARCADIDKVVATQEKRIALLKELKQSVITQAVTRGLNPDVKMKDSGVEWIGEVPEHWEKCRFKNFMALMVKPSLSSVKVGLENIESQTGRFIETDSEFEGNGTDFQKGDIVYGKLRPYLQKVWLAEFDGNAVGDFFVFRSRKNSDSKYLKYLLLSDGFTKEANSATEGAKMPRVSSEFILTLNYFLPPHDEQKTIADYIEKRCLEIDRQINGVSRQIDLLREYKQSLITEVVTGKRKVC